MSENPLLIILGPTASGKTKLAVQIAEALNGEIISADSRQVFKGMDIGTGKDLQEYKINGRDIPYHLIDHKQAGTRYQVNTFKEDFYIAFDDIIARQKLPVLCGGTGLYIHSLLQNHELTSIPVDQGLRGELINYSLLQLQEKLSSYPSTLTAHADQSTVKRLIRAIEIAEYLTCNVILPKSRTPFKPLVVGLTSSVARRRERIRERLEQRLQNGLIEEVETLIQVGVSKEMLVFYGLEYKFIVAHLAGELNFEQLKERLFTAICQFAKRQMTFFRKMEKDGVVIHWFNNEDVDGVDVKVKDLCREQFEL